MVANALVALTIIAPSTQVTSGAASAAVTIPNAAGGNLAQFVHIASKGNVYILPHATPFATGTIDLTGLPANNETLTVNGTVITFKTSGAAGSQINIELTPAAMALAIYRFLRDSVDANIIQARYAYDPTGAANQITVRFRLIGTGGNAFTLAEAAANLTVSGATLTGGAASTAATAANSILLQANTPIDLNVSGLNGISYIQETAASIVNISPIEA